MDCSPGAVNISIALRDELVKAAKHIQKLESQSAEKDARIQQLEAELSDAKNNHQHTIDIAERQKDQIDKLKKVIVRLNAERDAAVACLKKAANEKGECFGCKWYNGKNCTHPDYKMLCSSHDDKWQWIGVQKEE